MPSVWLSLGAAAALFPSASQPAAWQPAGRGVSAPRMLLDQMKSAVTEIKGQAAEAIVQKKVAEKLERAKEKYAIPDKYLNVMSGFFTSYMTEVYKAGLDMDAYEATLTTLFSKVGTCS